MTQCACGCKPAGNMTPQGLKERIQDEVARLVDDPEIAHGNEDLLHQSVLREVAAGNPYSQELAEIALTTLNIYFPRWDA